MSGKPNKYKPRQCVVCGKWFIPINVTQITCSKECGVKHNREQTKQRRARENGGYVPPSDNMQAIREISKKGIHYGFTVVEMEYGHKL